jgi:HK97 family phage major capsid protein
MEHIHGVIDTLTQAFQESKSNHEERLKELEKKASLDSALAHKMAHLSDEVVEKMKQFERIGVAYQRPAFDVSSEASSYAEESKADFVKYIRKGEGSGFDIKALSTTQEHGGGYLIPRVVVNRIGQDLQKYSPLRRLASVMQISSSSVDLLIDKKGADVGWVGETEERAETSTPELQKLSILVHEMYARPKATQKLLDDAMMNVEEWLSEKVALKMSEAEHQAFINGDGNKKPKGILSYPTVLGSAWEWGKLEHIEVDAELTVDHLLDMIGSLKRSLMEGASWLMSRSAFGELRKLKTKGQYIWHPSLEDKDKTTLFGYPVEVSDDMPAYAKDKASKPVLFGNFKAGYQIVDRADIHVLRDPFSSKPYVEFYTTKRVGGDVINFEAIKVLKYK